MWKSIAKTIAQTRATTFTIESKAPVTGGDIHQSFVINGNGQRYFVKINQLHHFELLEAEAYSLQQIRQSECIACPIVIAIGRTNEHAFLILDYLEFQHPSASLWYQLGKKLADMHQKTTHGQFGWQHDNAIGTTPQPNRWSSNWRQFFAEQRIAWQLQLLHEKSINFGNIDYITKVCHDILLHHQVSPCLLHGDLWRGNLGFTNNQPIIFDPASYYGDREADIAMTELFGALPEQFYQGYHDTYPLPDAYDVRKHVYNLYHVLNHANIFAGIYIDQAKACINRVLSLA